MKGRKGKAFERFQNRQRAKLQEAFYQRMEQRVAQAFGLDPRLLVPGLYDTDRGRQQEYAKWLEKCRKRTAAHIEATARHCQICGPPLEVRDSRTGRWR